MLRFLSEPCDRCCTNGVWNATYRTSGRDRDHRDPGQHAAAGAEAGEGRSAQVVSIPDSLSKFGIVAGDTITAGVRSDDNKYWTFTAPSGETIQPDHAQADMVDVQVLD